jgi:hypothetical protein
LRHFEREFAPFRDRAITVIEIGVAGGPSLRVWKQFFSLATIVGVDINPKCRAQASGRIAIEIGSQADPDFLNKIEQRHGTPSIVIDDGSHHADHIQFTFEHLFPLLAPGGCYVIEDLHFHFNPPTAQAWRGDAALMPQDYLTGIAKQILAGEFGANQTTIAPEPICGLVDRLTFLPGAVLIWKRHNDEADVHLTRWEMLAEQSGNAWNFDSLARKILARGWPVIHAEKASRRAVQLDTKSASLRLTLARVLEKSGDFRGASEALETAIALLPADDESLTTLERRLNQLRQRSSA